MMIVCEVAGGGSGVDEEVRRVQAECRYLSAEIQRLRDDNSKLRVGYLLFSTRNTALADQHKPVYSKALTIVCTFSSKYLMKMGCTLYTSLVVVAVVERTWHKLDTVASMTRYTI